MVDRRRPGKNKLALVRSVPVRDLWLNIAQSQRSSTPESAISAIRSKCKRPLQDIRASVASEFVKDLTLGAYRKRSLDKRERKEKTVKHPSRINRTVPLTFLLLVITLFTNPSISMTGENCAPLADGLISWYKAEGNADDTQGTHNGTLRNGVAFSSGVGGQAFSFDGVNDQVDLGNWFNLQTFTFELWVNVGASQVMYADIIDNNHTHFRSWAIQYTNTGSQFHFAGADGRGGLYF